MLNVISVLTAHSLVMQELQWLKKMAVESNPDNPEAAINDIAKQMFQWDVLLNLSK